MYLNIFVLTPVILFGLVGNILSMLTWSRGRHRSTSTAALLTALAVMDTVVLTMPALEYWVMSVFKILLRQHNTYACKLFGFASYFGPSSSSWIIVLVTGERLVSIWFPVKVRLFCTRAKVCICLAVVCCLLAAIYSPFLVETNLFISESQNTTSCDWDQQGSFYIHFYRVWMWIDLCLLFMIPFILIVIGNSLILYKLLKSRHILRRQGENASHRTRVANAFTIRAIILSIFFLICLLPVTTNEVYLAHTGVNNATANNISNILLYANSALNFILYCVVGSGFRKDMKSVLVNLCSSRKVRLDDQDGKSNASYIHHSLLHRNTVTMSSRDTNI